MTTDSTAPIGVLKKANRTRGDWVSQFIDSQCYETDDIGRALGVNVDKLLKLLELNGVSEEQIAGYRERLTSPYAVGSVRMTAGNLLRARFRREGNLVNLEGQKLYQD